MNKKLLKISLGIGVPIAVAGVTTGLVLGLKKNGDDGNSDNQHIDSLNTKSVKYFQNNIENHMQNAFLFPRNGKNLLSKFILIGKDKESHGLLYSQTEKSAKKIVLDFKKYSKLSEINEALTSANKALWDFQSDAKNASKRWGLEWSSNSKHDSININIYRVKDENTADKNIIDTYISDLESAKLTHIKKWASDKSSITYTYDFVRTLAGSLHLHEANFKELYPLNWSKGSNLDTKPVPLYKDDKGTMPVSQTNTKKVSDLPFYQVGNLDPVVASKPQTYSSKLLIWKDGTKIPFENRYAIDRPLNTYLTKNKIIPITQPILKLDEAKPSKLSLLITFYKVGPNSTIDFKTYKNARVNDPENVYTRTIDFDIKDILNGLSSPTEKAKLSDLKASGETIFSQIKTEWMKFISNTTATSLLPMMSDFIPTIGTTIKDMVSTFKFLKSLKDDGSLKIDNKDPFEYIFKENYGTKNNSLIDKILDKINNTDYFEPTQMFNVWFKNFNSDNFSDLNKFISTDTYYNIDASAKLPQMSSQKELYYFLAGINAFEPLIRERLNDLVSTGKLTVNFYDEISKNVINDFISILKKKNIIASTFQPTDLNKESERNDFISKVVQAVMDKKQITVPAGLFGVFIKDTNITSLLANVVNSDYASDILKLIKGNDTLQVAFADILKDPLNAIITRLMKNVDSQQSVLNNLKGKVDLKKIIKPLLGGDDKYSNIVDGLFNGFKTSKEFLDSFDGIIAKTGTVHDLLFGASNATGKQGLFKFLYEYNVGDSSAILSIAQITIAEVKPISTLIQKGINNLTVKEISEFLDSFKNIAKFKIPNNLLKNQLVGFFLKGDIKTSVESIVKTINKYIDIIFPGASSSKSGAQPSPEATKVAKLIHALV